MQGDKILSGAKIVVISSSELIRSEAYALLSMNGLESEATFPENSTELIEIYNTFSEEILICYLEENAIALEKNYKITLSSGIDVSQMVVGCVRNSLVHRIILRTGCEGFSFSVERNATGPIIDISGMISALQNCWAKRFLLQLDHEVNSALSSGSLGLLSELFLITTETLKERAHIVFALASTLNASYSLRRKLIRTSLFCDLVKSKNWKNTVDCSRGLWPIKNLLEKRAEYVFNNIVRIGELPPDLPIELVILEAALLIEKDFKTETDLQKSLTLALSKQRIEVRLNVQTAVDSCLKKLWRYRFDGKASAG